MQQSSEQHQILHVPLSAIGSTTAAALATSLMEKLASFRHGRSSMNDERHKQQKLIGRPVPGLRFDVDVEEDVK